MTMNLASPHLPDHLIQHIFSLLPLPAAARTSVLSKKFLSAWRSSNIILVETNSNLKRPEFLSHARNSCQQSTSPLRTFILDICYGDDQIEELLLFALENCTFEVQFSIGKHRFPLPKSPFASTSSLIRLLTIQRCTLNLLDVASCCPLLKSLTLSYCDLLGENPRVSSTILETLELHKCRTEFQDEVIDIDAPNLQQLIYVDSKSVEINIGSCKRITQLVLKTCSNVHAWFEDYVSKLVRLDSLTLDFFSGLRPIDISNPCLRELNILRGREIVRIVSTPKLEVLKFTGSVIYECPEFMSLNPRHRVDIAPASCRLLKSLVLKTVQIQNWVLLERELPKLALLQHLELRNCCWGNRSRIYNENLKSLSLHDCLYISLPELVINTPRLRTFMCCTELLPRINLFYHSSSLHAQLVLQSSRDFSRFGEFLASFDRCEELSLIGRGAQDMLAHACKNRGALLTQLPSVKLLKVRLYNKTMSDVQVLNTLVWLFPHLQVLTFVTRGRRELSFRAT